jgi:hypothetical protein
MGPPQGEQRGWRSENVEMKKPGEAKLTLPELNDSIRRGNRRWTVRNNHAGNVQL